MVAEYNFGVELDTAAVAMILDGGPGSSLACCRGRHLRKQGAGWERYEANGARAAARIPGRDTDMEETGVTRLFPTNHHSIHAVHRLHTSAEALEVCQPSRRMTLRRMTLRRMGLPFQYIPLAKNTESTNSCFLPFLLGSE